MDVKNITQPIRNDNPLMKRLRTYKSDVAESIKIGKHTFAGIIIAEKEKRERGGARAGQLTEQSGEKKNFTRNYIFIAISAIFALFAFGIFAFLFVGTKTKEETAVPTIVAWNPIFTEVDKKIILELVNENDLKRNVKKIKKETAIPINGVLGITFVKITETSDGPREAFIGTQELVSALPNDIPQQLLRTVSDSFFFGFHSSKKTAPFLILKNRFYDGAFLGMLEWERFMFHDLAPLFLLKSPAGQKRFFEDAIIKNNDIRVLKDDGGETALLYGFIDRNTIVITTDTDALAEIVTRLKTPRPITR